MTLVDDDLRVRLEPLLPKRRSRQRQYAGRRPIPDRAVLTGILFVLRSGIPWNMRPREMGCGSGTTCWRRLARLQRAGVWKRLHTVLLTELQRRGQVDLARAVVDSASLRALRGGKTGPNPTDRRKAGSKHHVLTDAPGIPLVARLTGANRHDVTQLLPLVDALPVLRGSPARQAGHAARQRPGTHALGCRADAGVVAPILSARRSLRASPLHSRGVSHVSVRLGLLVLLEAGYLISQRALSLGRPPRWDTRHPRYLD